jgi:hypothetical protein
MKTLLAVLWVLLPFVARAHIGSPNVFYDGKAGPHAVRVIIRPPATLPGFAQMDVRVGDTGAARVKVQPVFSGGGVEASAAPTEAIATPGDERLFSAPIWILRSGSYAVHVAVESPLGRGEAIVPLQAAPTQSPTMPAGLVAMLLGLGALLFAGAVAIARAAAREATLAPGAEMGTREISRGRHTAIVAVVLLGTTVWLGAERWRWMDREFRNNALARPVPVEASVRAESAQNLLRIVPAPENAEGTAWDTLVTDHGKLMHLFLIREAESGPAAFAHLHPVRRDARAFEGLVPPLPGGSYQLYGELTYEDGRSETLFGKVALPESSAAVRQANWTMLNDVWCQSPIFVAGNAAQPSALDFDDSWHVNSPGKNPEARTSFLMGGNRMLFETPGDLVANRETSLRFTVVNPAGEVVPIQRYMGMDGHAVIRRTDGAVFTHLHPAGTISMAAQQLFAGVAGPAASAPAGPAEGAREVAFPYAFPRGGEYRMWVQVRVSGRVLTGVFEVRVRE